MSILGRPSEGGPTVAQFLQSLPDYQYEEGESLLTDLLESVARVLTFRDIVTIVMGNSSVFSRIQTPLRQFILRRITDNGRIPIETAVVKLLDDNYSILEDAVRVASVISFYTCSVRKRTILWDVRANLLLFKVIEWHLPSVNRG